MIKMLCKKIFILFLFLYPLVSNSQKMESNQKYELKIGQKFKFREYRGLFEKVNKVEKVNTVE